MMPAKTKNNTRNCSTTNLPLFHSNVLVTALSQARAEEEDGRQRFPLMIKESKHQNSLYASIQIAHFSDGVQPLS